MAHKVDTIYDAVAGTPDPLTGVRSKGLVQRVDDHHEDHPGAGISIKTRDKMLIIISNGIVAAVLAWMAATGGAA